MSKSAFIEFILKEQMNTTNQLFNSSDTLSEALVFLSKQMQDIKDLMSDDNYKKYLEKLSEVQNGGAVQTDTHEVQKAPMMLMSAKYLEVLTLFIFVDTNSV